MASLTPFQTLFPRTRSSASLSAPALSGASPPSVSWTSLQTKNKSRKPSTVVAAVGDVSSDSTTYLIAGAIGVALIGTAFPLFFSRKDTCPECDGAGFVRKAGATLRANAARKDQAQIVCARCNGLGKLNQIDK
ncbi:uncharacterized protein LOC129291053 [Prosopis cineraria]|uniref:uncharacterized protein LOC129291053 n=1 Tax=Prosopis cineraria TaxID=364024 RepID=UPI00240EF826|nr:uncharacterized protein LOC129291053 [Prosopis cineraria]